MGIQTLLYESTLTKSYPLWGGGVTQRGSKVQIQGMQEQIILMLKEDAFMQVDPAGSLLTCLFVLPRRHDFKNLKFLTLMLLTFACLSLSSEYQQVIV